ncbi:hypothetical protein PPGU19_093600 (plasmid) [Paraburkholderia sp. PGU19]|nr:hypothetical protein PPGU19_093600 [Paraburkholderia sp. PGU19]
MPTIVSGVRCAERELFRCQRGPAQKIDRKPEAKISQAGAVHLIRCIEDVAGDVTANERRNQSKRRGMPCKVEYVHVSNGCRIDVGVDIADRKRRIDEYLFTQPGIRESNKVGTHRCGRIRAWLEFLGRYLHDGQQKVSRDERCAPIACVK